MISNYKVKVNDSCNYKVSITDIQNKYKFKLFCAGADLTDYYTKEQVDQSQNTQDILIDNILNQIPTGTATGETINITDSSSLPLKDIQVAGNTYQANAILPSGYTQVDYIRSTGGQYIDTGINADTKLRTILDISFINPTSANQTMGAINIGTPNKRYHLLSGINSISFWVNDTNYSIINSASTDRHLWDLNVPEGKVVLDNTTTTTIPTNIDDVELSFWLFGRNSTGTKYKAPFKLWACKMYYNETLVRDYIPCYRNSDNEVGLYDLVNNVFYTNQGTGTFTYGSTVNIPNPDYPQTITNVTGTNAIKINGKNLFNSTDFESQLVAGKIKNDNGVEVNDTTSQYSQYFIPVKANQPYYFHGYLQRIYLYDANKNWVGRVVGSSATTIMNTSYTPTIDGYIQLQIHTNTYNANKGEEQIELGSSYTGYETYQEQNYTINLGDIELCKIGDYKDRIYSLNGKWYLEKQIGKVVLDGTQDLYKVTTGTSGYSRYNIDIGTNVFTTDNATIVAPIYCNRLVGVTRTNTYNRIEGIAPTTTSYSYRSFNLYIEAISQMTVEQANTWLSNNPTIVYYQYKTPTTEEITDTTLIGQLDALLNSTTYKTTTNITIDTTNQKPTLTLTYRKDLETLIGG